MGSVGVRIAVGVPDPRGGPPSDLDMITIDGEMVGPWLAVTPTIGWDGRIPRFTVTHVPTGWAVTHLHDREAARALAERLNACALDWGTLTVEGCCGRSHGLDEVRAILAAL